MVCKQAIHLAGPFDPERFNAACFSTLVIAALTIDEVASKLGQPQLAREPLENALVVLESANRNDTRHRSDELIGTERRVRDRLEQLGSPT